MIASLINDIIDRLPLLSFFFAMASYKKIAASLFCLYDKEKNGIEFIVIGQAIGTIAFFFYFISLGANKLN